MGKVVAEWPGATSALYGAQQPARSGLNVSHFQAVQARHVGGPLACVVFVVNQRTVDGTHELGRRYGQIGKG